MTDEQIERFGHHVERFRAGIGAFAEISSMNAENDQRTRRGESAAYLENSFSKILDIWGIIP